VNWLLVTIYVVLLIAGIALLWRAASRSLDKSVEDVVDDVETVADDMSTSEHLAELKRMRESRADARRDHADDVRRKLLHSEEDKRDS
jgi:hypothetical protein